MQLQRYDSYFYRMGEVETIPPFESDRMRSVSIHQHPLSKPNYATFTTSTPKELMVSIDVVCHMSFTLHKDATYYSSCFDQTWMKDDPAGDAYYDWMTSDESPWRILFKYGKPERIYPKDGKGGGFIIDANAVCYLPNKWPLYNFMVAMRMVSEEVDSIRTWHRLVDLGLHPADALYLSRLYVIQNHEGDSYLKPSGANNGCHWPLSDDIYGSYSETYHSFARFRDGVMVKADSSSGIWRDDTSRPIFTFKGQADARGRACENLYYPTRIIDAFKEYLKG